MIAAVENVDLPVKVSMPQVCPLCGDESLGATDDEFYIRDILERWQREAGVTFSETVWREYTVPVAPTIVLHRCTNCGFAIFRPVLAGSIDFYKCLATGDGSSYYSAAKDKWEYSRAIADMRRHGCASVLEIGSGSGSFLDVLRDCAPNITRVGFELNEDMARVARNKGHDCYSGNSLDVIENDKFDAICIFHAIEHVAEPQRLLKKMRRLLNVDGLLLIAVPNNAGPVQYFSEALTDLP